MVPNQKRSKFLGRLSVIGKPSKRLNPTPSVPVKKPYDGPTSLASPTPPSARQSYNGLALNPYEVTAGELESVSARRKSSYNPPWLSLCQKSDGDDRSYKSLTLEDLSPIASGRPSSDIINRSDEITGIPALHGQVPQGMGSSMVASHPSRRAPLPKPCPLWAAMMIGDKDKGGTTSFYEHTSTSTIALPGSADIPRRVALDRPGRMQHNHHVGVRLMRVLKSEFYLCKVIVVLTIQRAYERRLASISSLKRSQERGSQRGLNCILVENVDVVCLEVLGFLFSENLCYHVVRLEDFVLVVY